MAENKKKRQSRLKRSRTPQGLQLQKRDKSIITAVYQHRYLTRSQIQRLFRMKCVTRINIRLRKLFDHNFLDRHFRPTVTGSSQAVYFLGKNGISIVTNTLKIDDKKIWRRRRSDLAVKDISLDHNLQVNNFRINLARSIENNHRFELVKWLDARDCEYKSDPLQRGKRIITSLRPDGYFELLYQKEKYAFFVEIDLSTSNYAKLRSKFERYIVFAKKQLYKKKYKRELFYVLVATNSKSRAEKLHRLAGKLKPEMFWFATLQEIEHDILFGPIWRRSGHTIIRPLFRRPKVRAI